MLPTISPGSAYTLLTHPPPLPLPPPLFFSFCFPCSGSFYPGTGAAHEVGEGAGEGYSVNVPWPCGGMRNGDYLAAFHHVLLPIAYGEAALGDLSGSVGRGRAEEGMRQTWERFGCLLHSFSHSVC